MFVDASAVVAIIDLEEGWQSLTFKLNQAQQALMSPLSIWESVIALTRTRKRTFDVSDGLVLDFIATFGIETIPITAEIGTLALDASRRFGRGRHKADLNFGDCFAYACARHRGLPLLFKGDDFVHTDIVAA